MLHNHQNVSHTGQRSGEPDLSHKKSRNVLVMSHVTQDQKVHGGVHKHLCTSAARIPTPGSASYTAVITMNLPKPNTAGERGHPDGQVLDMQTSLSTDRHKFLGKENKKGKKQDSKQSQRVNTGENPTRSTWYISNRCQLLVLTLILNNNINFKVLNLCLKQQLHKKRLMENWLV